MESHDTPQHGDEHNGFAYGDTLTVGGGSTPGYLLDAMRRRRVGRAVLEGLIVVLFIGGAGLFMYPLFTDVYTEQVLQRRLEDELVRIEVDTFEEWQTQVSQQTGAALTQISIPAIDIETIVVEGTSPAALRAGAGHYPNTPLPGQTGNVAIAGHRTTYGKPFNRLDELKIGDEIWLVTPVGDHKYVVSAELPSDQCRRPSADSGACVTTPQDWGVISPPGSGNGGSGGDHWLTLTTCHPKGSAAERLVIRAVLEQSLPHGAYEEAMARQASEA